jgi:hypothetical protein
MIARCVTCVLLATMTALALGCSEQQNVAPQNPPATLPAPTQSTDAAK